VTACACGCRWFARRLSTRHQPRRPDGQDTPQEALRTPGIRTATDLKLAWGEEDPEEGSYASIVRHQLVEAVGGNKTGIARIEIVLQSFENDASFLARIMVTIAYGSSTNWESPESDKRSGHAIEADEVGASLKFATAKVERAIERSPSDRSQGRERPTERGGDDNQPPPF
jgi:hypothetical protein